MCLMIISTPYELFVDHLMCVFCTFFECAQTLYAVLVDDFFYCPFMLKTVLNVCGTKVC
jgi:hypothetical protein